MADISLELLVVAANRIGATLLPDIDDQWTNRLQIKSETSTALYIVAQKRKDGSWGCSCRGWKSHRHCKHLDTMLPLLIAAPARPTNIRGR